MNNAPQGISFFTIGIEGESDQADLIAFGRNGFFTGNNISQLGNVFDTVAGSVISEANSYYLF